jgi:hypothetical protein
MHTLAQANHPAFEKERNQRLEGAQRRLLKQKIRTLRIDEDLKNELLSEKEKQQAEKEKQREKNLARRAEEQAYAYLRSQSSVGHRLNRPLMEDYNGDITLAAMKSKTGVYRQSPAWLDDRYEHYDSSIADALARERRAELARKNGLESSDSDVARLRRNAGQKSKAVADCRRDMRLYAMGRASLAASIVKQIDLTDHEKQLLQFKADLIKNERDKKRYLTPSKERWDRADKQMKKALIQVAAAEKALHEAIKARKACY